MPTPSKRRGASRPTNHHMLWDAASWKNGDRVHERARAMPEYQYPLPQVWHDRTHAVLGRLSLPHRLVVTDMVELAQEYKGFDTRSRIDRIVDEMIGLANRDPSPEMADQRLEVASHFTGQMAILQLSKGVFKS